QAGPTDFCRSFAGAARSKEFRFYGDRRVEKIGRAAEGKTILIERELYCGERPSCDCRSAVALANGQGSTGCRSGNTCLLTSNEWGAAAAQCSATGNSGALGSSATNPATGSNFRSGTICDCYP